MVVICEQPRELSIITIVFLTKNKSIMFTKKKYTLLLSLFTIFALTAQKEQNNWFFGVNAGLTWNTPQSFVGAGLFGVGSRSFTNIPTVITGSLMNTAEGCFSISDANGNLLFFSDGMTIWNKNKVAMYNGTGLTGNASSAQSGIIFPYPNSNTRYIAISLGERDANNLAYSIVDMNHASGAGLGGVEAANKNQLFTGQQGTLGESVTAVRHTNKEDFWVIAVGKGATTYFNVWKITQAAGIQKARHSGASLARVTATTSPAGYIKFTQDGKHFAWVSFNESFFAYGDFNPTTGIISNVKSRTDVRPLNARGYGLEFSPNDRYLYITYSPGSTSSTTQVTSAIHIYDMNTLLASTTPNNVSPIKTFQLGPSYSDGKSDLFSGIQLGPDNRMYVSDYYTNSLFLVPDPNTPTTTNVYKLNGLLGTGRVMFGLPSFAAPWFKIILTPPTSLQGCAEYDTTYSLNIEPGMGFSAVTKVIIDFGDNDVNAKKTITNPATGITSHSYKYRNPGTYTVTATAYNAANGVELSGTTKITINSCAMRVNPHVSVSAGR